MGVGLEENLFKFDFLPLILGWGLFYYFIYSVKSEPIGLMQIEDFKKREVERHLYLTNYPAMLHAVLICILSKPCLCFTTNTFLGLICMIIYPRTTMRDLEPFEAFMFRVSISYLVFDTFLGIVKKYNDIYMFVHHLVMFAVYFIAFY